MAKFKLGDDIDSAHSNALKHEFLRCEESFNDFVAYGHIMIHRAQVEAERNSPTIAHDNRFIAYKTYNAYASFIHHLYEFMVGALARDTGTTAQIDHEIADQYITSHVNRILTGRRTAILNGTAPAWENHISAFPERVPPEFASEFRAHRNKISGHVKYRAVQRSYSPVGN